MIHVFATIAMSYNNNNNNNKIPMICCYYHPSHNYHRILIKVIITLTIILLCVIVYGWKGYWKNVCGNTVRVWTIGYHWWLLWMARTRRTIIMTSIRILWNGSIQILSLLSQKHSVKDISMKDYPHRHHHHYLIEGNNEIMERDTLNRSS